MYNMTKIINAALCHSSVGKESACSAGDPSSIPGSGRSPGEGKGYPLQYSGLENSMDLLLSSSHVWMWELDYKESWVLKNWCFWTVVLEKTLESPLDCKEIQPVHPKGDQSWVFIGRTDAEAEAPILWPPDVKNWFIWKDPDAGKDWGLEEKGTTEDEMVGWHHWLNWHGFGWTPGVGDEQGDLACCSSWGRKELDTTEWLNWTELNTVHGVAELDMTERLSLHSLISYMKVVESTS